MPMAICSENAVGPFVKEEDIAYPFCLSFESRSVTIDRDNQYPLAQCFSVEKIHSVFNHLWVVIFVQRQPIRYLLIYCLVTFPFDNTAGVTQNIYTLCLTGNYSCTVWSECHLFQRMYLSRSGRDGLKYTKWPSTN